MTTNDCVQFVGGPMNGQEQAVYEILPEYRFARLSKGFRWDTPSPEPVEVDIYVRLLDTNIYIYKGIE